MYIPVMCSVIYVLNMARNMTTLESQMVLRITDRIRNTYSHNKTLAWTILPWQHVIKCCSCRGNNAGLLTVFIHMARNVSNLESQMTLKLHGSIRGGNLKNKRNVIVMYVTKSHILSVLSGFKRHMYRSMNVAVANSST